MTTASALVAYCYNADGTLNNDRVTWLVAQRDALVNSQLAGATGATSSLLSAYGLNKSASFQIDLTGPDKLEVITDALEILGQIPAIALPTKMTFASFACLER